MGKTRRTDPELWEKVKKEVTAGKKGGDPGEWSARKAQLAVKLYKKRGGDYIGAKKRDNSLRIWTKEDWQYIDGDPENRYLPKAVIDKLTPAQKKEANKRKRQATRKGKQFADYQPAVIELMEELGIGDVKRPQSGGGANRLFVPLDDPLLWQGGKCPLQLF